MDQVKEYLKLAVKYRFWIVVAIAALMPIIGYAVAAGPINELATAKTTEIPNAEKDVKAYQSGDHPVPKWTELTTQKTEVLTGDVNRSWQKLYERQAPLL